MNIVSAIVLYLVIWFMCLFVILPMRLKSQDEDGDVVPGTPASAPVNPNLKRKAVLITIVATLVFIPIAGVIISGLVTIDDIDVFNRRQVQ